MIDQIEARSQGLRRPYKGLAGFKRYIKRNRDLAEAGLEAMDLDQLTVETQDGDWAAYYGRMQRFLNLPGPALRLAQEAIDTPAELALENRGKRSLVAYAAPFKQRLASCAFELAPGERRIYKTTRGNRLLIHDTCSGELLEEVIVAHSRQALILGA